MTALKYLEGYEKANALIEIKTEKIAQLKDKSIVITVQGFSEKVQSSGKMDKMAQAVVDYSDLEEEVQREIETLEQKKAEIEKTLECLPTAEYKVLHKRFIELKELYIIADELGRSYSWVCKKKKIAMRHVQEILNERAKV